MARTKKVEETTIENKELEATEKVIEKTKEQDLKEQLAQSEKEKNDMMDMIKSLQAQMQLLASTQTGGQVTIKQNEDLTRTVKVTCLIDNTYNLSTEPLGGGKAFTFKKFGETKNIMFTDMQKILEIYKKDFEIGRAILGSKKDYEDLNLGYAYDKVLTLDKMEELISLNDKESIDIILEMNEDMQDDVMNLIAERMAKGESYDYNRIKELEDEGFELTKLAKMLEQEV